MKGTTEQRAAERRFQIFLEVVPLSIMGFHLENTSNTVDVVCKSYNFSPAALIHKNQNYLQVNTVYKCIKIRAKGAKNTGNYTQNPRGNFENPGGFSKGHLPSHF